jgi:DeoR/GlpR family transcriptional regulator of sugar metabolism
VSKGISKQQQKILDELRTRPTIQMHELQKEFPGRTDSIRRAVNSLAKRELIEHFVADVDDEDVEMITLRKSS